MTSRHRNDLEEDRKVLIGLILSFKFIASNARFITSTQSIVHREIGGLN